MESQQLRSDLVRLFEAEMTELGTEVGTLIRWIGRETALCEMFELDSVCLNGVPSVDFNRQSSKGVWRCRLYALGSAELWFNGKGVELGSVEDVVAYVRKTEGE